MRDDHPYIPHLHNKQFIEDWIKTCKETDGCSSGVLKYIWSVVLWFLKRSRIYKCCCKDHDFDFRHGWKYGMTFELANTELRECVASTGYPKTGKVMEWGIKKFGRKFFQTG